MNRFYTTEELDRYILPLSRIAGNLEKIRRLPSDYEDLDLAATITRTMPSHLEFMAEVLQTFGSDTMMNQIIQKFPSYDMVRYSAKICKYSLRVENELLARSYLQCSGERDDSYARRMMRYAHKLHDGIFGLAFGTLIVLFDKLTD